MKIKLTRKQAAPPNVAAKALRLGQFQHKIEKNPKAYSRKVKHRKGSPVEQQPPFLLAAAEGDETGK
jgi:hypothetical protein